MPCRMPPKPEQQPGALAVRQQCAQCLPTTLLPSTPAMRQGEADSDVAPRAGLGRRRESLRLPWRSRDLGADRLMRSAGQCPFWCHVHARHYAQSAMHFFGAVCFEPCHGAGAAVQAK